MFVGCCMESGKENGRRMAKRGENRPWEALCPLHMHAITQVAIDYPKVYLTS